MNTDPYDPYYNIKAISATALKAGARSMAAMKRVMDGDSARETDAMRLGTATHRALLEPERVAVVPYAGVRHGQSWRVFSEAAESKGQMVLKSDDYYAMMKMITAARENERIIDLLRECKTEIVITWAGMHKAKIDAWQAATHTLIEVKTMRDISERAFARTFYASGFDIQLAWYRRAIRSQGQQVDAAYIIALQSGDEPDAMPIRIPLGCLDSADRKIDSILWKWHVACLTGDFSGCYGDAEEVTFVPPVWAVEEMDMSTEEGEASEL